MAKRPLKLPWSGRRKATPATPATPAMPATPALPAAPSMPATLPADVPVLAIPETPADRAKAVLDDGRLLVVGGVAAVVGVGVAVQRIRARRGAPQGSGARADLENCPATSLATMRKVLDRLNLSGATPEWLQGVAEYKDWGGQWVESDWMPTKHLKQVLEDVNDYAGSHYPDLAWSLKHGHWRDWVRK